MKYVLAALREELPGRELDPSEYKVWYTGVGKINATIFATLACIQSDCDMVINYGTAGTLKPDLKGRMIQVGTVRQRDMDCRPKAELGVTPLEEGALAGDIVLEDHLEFICSSGDQFVHSTPELESDIVDMESYAIAKVCSHFKKKMFCFKYITDFANENGLEDWEKNHAKGADAFRGTLTALKKGNIL
jgi:adenosylhomocysteine nucleosidase